MARAEWKVELCNALSACNQRNRGYGPLIAEYQKLLGLVGEKTNTVGELQRQVSVLKDQNATLAAEANQLRLSGSEETKKRLEELEMKMHAQQEELTAAYRTKLENTEEMLRLNHAVKQLESQAATAKSEIGNLRHALDERNATITNLESALQAKADALLALKTEYDGERSAREQLQGQMKQLQGEHDKLVQRWMDKVRADAERMNKQLEAEEKRIQQKKSKELQESAMRNFGAALSMSDMELSLVPERKRMVLEAHSSEGNDVCFSPSGMMLASGSSARDVKLWDSHGSLQRTLAGQVQAVMCVHFSPNEEYVLGASNDNSIRVWRSQSGQVLHSLNGHQNKVYSAQFCSDANKIVSGSCDRTIKYWDLTKGYCTRTILCISSCNSVSPDKSGFTVASGHFDKSVKLWDMRDGKEVHKIDDVHSAQITHVEFSLDSRRLLTCGRDGVLKVCDVRTYEMLLQMTHRDLSVPLNWSKAAFSPDSNYAVVGGQDGSVFIFDTQTGNAEKILRGYHQSYVASCAWSNVNSCVASIDKDGKVVLWGP